MAPARRWLAVVALAASGCGSVTGVDVELVGADKLQADHVVVAGSFGDAASLHTAELPDSPRALGATEDVRLILPDGDAGRVLWLDVKTYKGSALVDEQTAAAALATGETKRVKLCLGAAAGCF